MEHNFDSDAFQREFVNYMRQFDNININRSTVQQPTNLSTKPGKGTKKIKLENDNLAENLFKDEATKDFTIVGGEAKVKCHKLVLRARSNWFATMLQNAEMAEVQSGELKLETSEWGVEQLVRFLYGMEIPEAKITPEKALELLQNGHAYKLPELVLLTGNFLLGKDKEWFKKEEDADALLELFYFTQKLDNDEVLRGVSKHLLKILSMLPSENIRKANRFQELTKEETINLFCSLHDMQI